MSAGQLLNLGTVLSKGETNVDLPFSLEEDQAEAFQVNPELFATGRTCVIGSSGSGKSYTVGVICEELCKNKVPFVIVDTEGEYSGLKDKYNVVWIGDDPKSDIRWNDKIDLSLGKEGPGSPANCVRHFRSFEAQGKSARISARALQGDIEAQNALPDHSGGGGPVLTSGWR